MTDPASLADSLFDAWRTGVGLPPEAIPDLDLQAAYAVQARLQAHFTASGREAIGWKIGLTSAAAMAAFRAEEPMVGVIYRDTVVRDGGRIDLARLIAPRIEGEMLIEIGAVPASDADDDTLLASIAKVRAAFEIADSRVAGWPTAVGALVADNAACGLIVYAADQGVVPAKDDLSGAAMTMKRGGDVVAQGGAADCLGGIMNVYRWFLADSARTGRHLEPGQVILCGAMGQAVPMRLDSDYHMFLAGVGKLQCFTRGVHPALGHDRG